MLKRVSSPKSSATLSVNSRFTIGLHLCEVLIARMRSVQSQCTVFYGDFLSRTHSALNKPNWSLPLFVDFHGRQKPLAGKADQSTLASGGSEHA